jgi:hypothetical protein
LTRALGACRLGVNMPDTKRTPKENIEDALVATRRRRENADRKVDETRQELGRLLLIGQRIGLEVASMARLAGVSRETAHKLLRVARVDQKEGDDA